MLVTAKEMLGDAQKRGYAVCAPNFFDYETAKACIEMAEELNAPILLDFGFRGQITRDEMIRMMRFVAIRAEESRVPVVLQQDHGKNFESCISCIRAGFTSIMADWSSSPYEENVKQVKDLARIAHACGISIEAELGHVGDGKKYDEEGGANLTEPEDAVRFVEETGVDSLAIAIGTAHGAYSGTPYLDFDRLEAIRKVVSIPLVLHGGSSTGDDKLARAARSGMSKINIATDLVTAAADAAVEARAKGDQDIFFSKNYIAGYKAKLAHYMELFGQVGKAEGWGL